MAVSSKQQQGIDYEFTLALELDMHHKAKASKDRTGLFMDKDPFLITPETQFKRQGHLFHGSLHPGWMQRSPQGRVYGGPRDGILGRDPTRHDPNSN